MGRRRGRSWNSRRRGKKAGRRGRRGRDDGGGRGETRGAVACMCSSVRVWASLAVGPDRHPCWEEENVRRTRQTILPHRRQSLTRSLAQVDTLPETRCPASPSMCHFRPGFSLSIELASRNSFSQRSVCCTRRLRYCKRLARTWRHVRERASSVFRSKLCASWVTMLGCRFQSVVTWYVWKDTRSRWADVRIGAQGC